MSLVSICAAAFVIAVAALFVVILAATADYDTELTDEEWEWRQW